MAADARRPRTRLPAARVSARSTAAAVAPTHVAFLRAVNVGGRGVVKMADVVAALAKAGCTGATSYGHAGNLLWAQQGSAAPEAKMRAGLARLLGAPPGMTVRTRREMAAIVAANPFGRLVGDKEVKLYVVFLERKPTRIPTLPVRVDKDALELIAITGRDAYVVSRKIPGRLMYGFPNQFVEQLLGVAGTTRNWSTVMKTAALMASPGRVT